MALNRSDWQLLALLAISPLFSGAGGCDGGGPGQCASDAECTDNVYCNGIEVCSPANPSADSMGCLRLAPAACPVGAVCSNADRRCMPVCTTASSTNCISQCTTDDDCNDEVFCNGTERCQPGASGANARGCLASTYPACGVYQVCDEAEDRCTTDCPDADGDGHSAVHCGGNDCDDTDGNRFPGNAEVCDAADHDEDCDPSTYGIRDVDGDGYHDAACCNGTVCGDDCNDNRSNIHPDQVDPCDGVDDNCDGLADEDTALVLYPDADRDGYGAGTGVRACVGASGLSTLNNDCDDANPAIVPGAVVCDSVGAPTSYQLCTSAGTYTSGKCNTCTPQPNGTGVCL